MTRIALTILFCGLIVVSQLSAYPIDGYVHSQIRRLLWLQKVINGETQDKMPVDGALLSIDSIALQLVETDTYSDGLPEVDPDFQRQLNSLFPHLHESYSISVLDYSDPESWRYAERQANRGFQPGSVGKLAVVTGLFCELQSIYPDDPSARVELLKSKVVKAGKWALPNIHTVPIYHTNTGKLEKRLLIESDEFSLFEWADHMLSVSSNGAASVVWRELLLMRYFGADYADLSFEEGEAYFKKESRARLSEIALSVVNDHLRDLGISEDDWRLGTLFTRGGSDRIPPKGGSIATPRALLTWMLALEQGRVVDPESSLEIKRLMYMTDRRIRYASNTALKDAAVYFKSGSLYQCQPEPGYTCAKYMGNKNNYMNSVAIVERGDSIRYMVALMTNVLKKNSNTDHSALGGRIDQLIMQDYQ